MAQNLTFDTRATPASVVPPRLQLAGVRKPLTTADVRRFQLGLIRMSGQIALLHRTQGLRAPLARRSFVKAALDLHPRYFE